MMSGDAKSKGTFAPTLAVSGTGAILFERFHRCFRMPLFWIMGCCSRLLRCHYLVSV
jgi:hypothetical protein